jgi:hypothetical protein
MHEWEHWELADEKLKDPVRTHWMEDISWKKKVKKVEMKRVVG